MNLFESRKVRLTISEETYEALVRHGLITGQTASECVEQILQGYLSVSSNATDYDDQFQLFWSHYPRKVGKKDAYKAWNRVSTERQKVIEAAEKYASSPMVQAAETCFIPYPAKWLREERWRDVEDWSNTPAANNGTHGSMADYLENQA